MSTKFRQLAPNDRVRIPWGLDDLEATVLYVYGPPARRHVMVRVPVLGASGEILEEMDLALPEDAVTPI